MTPPTDGSRASGHTASTVPMALAVAAMVAFAGNSLLCRLALHTTVLDPASFTLVRLASGAATLWMLCRLRKRRHAAPTPAGDWPSAVALFAYAAAFSFAYVALPAAVGALLLFGAVQATMTAVGLWRGERLGRGQAVGYAVALAGLVALLLPGLSAPPAASAGLMLASGVAWGVYSLRGAHGGDPLARTAGNFLRAVPLALLLALGGLLPVRFDPVGVGYAIASGAVASGLGYAAWYAVLPRLRALQASAMQLAVPPLTAAGGVLLLGEPVGLRLALCSAAILGGVLVVMLGRARHAG